jgi:hypothetical protein
MDDDDHNRANHDKETSLKMKARENLFSKQVSIYIP